MIHLPSAPASRLALQTLEGDSAAWDRYVAAAPDATFCHLAAWREVIGDVMGHETLYWSAVDKEGERQGVLPLVRVRSRIFGHYLVSMPFLNYGGPLGTPEAQRFLMEQATSEATSSGVDLLEIRARHEVQSTLPISHRKITVILRLRPSVDEMWSKGIPASRRRQVRRARGDGMEVRFGPDQLGAFYSVFARNMRQLGTPVLPRAVFERIARTLPEQALFAAVYWRGQPLAGACGFIWRGEFEITWVSSLREHDRKYPNMLLYWALMERMVQSGASVFNFGRCTPDGPTHRFKRQWGGTDVSLPWPQWSPAGLSSTPTPDSPTFKLATSVWRRLPLAITNRLGPCLSRQIP